MSEINTKRTLTDWGIEVKKAVIEKSIKQNDIVAHLNKCGFKINKCNFSNLLFGIGVKKRAAEIAEINSFLKLGA